MVGELEGISGWGVRVVGYLVAIEADVEVINEFGG